MVGTLKHRSRPGGTAVARLDIRDTPRYARAQVARLVVVPESTVRNWARGYRYPTQAGARRSKPLVVPPIRSGDLSFTNLVEAHTITGFRSSGVSMQRIRPALEYLARHLGVEHPLASENLLTDGVDVFWEYIRESEDGALTQLLNISRHGQAVFADVIRDYLERIDFASDGYADKLWPAGRNLGISVDPDRGFGAPIVDRRAVSVDHIVGRLRAGESKRSVARDYRLTTSEVGAALAFAPRVLPNAA